MCAKRLVNCNVLIYLWYILWYLWEIFQVLIECLFILNFRHISSFRDSSVQSCQQSSQSKWEHILHMYYYEHRMYWRYLFRLWMNWNISFMYKHKAMSVKKTRVKFYRIHLMCNFQYFYDEHDLNVKLNQYGICIHFSFIFSVKFIPAQICNICWICNLYWWKAKYRYV